MYNQKYMKNSKPIYFDKVTGKNRYQLKEQTIEMKPRKVN